MPVCHIGLGGNVGRVAETFDAALKRLAAAGCILKAVSAYRRTAPVGRASGEPFLNAAAALDTPRTPFELLELLQSIEAQLGRTREVRWAPRTLDLDLLLCGEAIIESPELTVPHPACWYRRFVLDPLAEIASEVVHPVKKATIGALRDRLLVRPLPVALAGGDPRTRDRLKRLLEAEFPAVEPAQWESTGLHGAAKRNWAFIVWLGEPAAASADQPAARSTRAAFAALPLLPRIDATSSAVPPDEFVRDLLHAALGE